MENSGDPEYVAGRVATTKWLNFYQVTFGVSPMIHRPEYVSWKMKFYRRADKAMIDLQTLPNHCDPESGVRKISSVIQIF